MIDGDTSKQAKINNPSQMIYVHNAAGRNSKVAVAQVWTVWNDQHGMIKPRFRDAREWALRVADTETASTWWKVSENVASAFLI